MAAFSYQPHPFLLDSIFLPNTPTKVSGFMEEGNINSDCFSQFYPSEPFQESPLDPKFHESSCLDHSSKVAHSDNEPSVTKKQSTDDSTVVDKLESGEQVTQNVTLTDRKRRTRNGTTLNSAQYKVNCLKSMFIYMCMSVLIYLKFFCFSMMGFLTVFQLIRICIQFHSLFPLGSKRRENQEAKEVQ